MTQTSVSPGTIISIEATFDWRKVYCPCGRRQPDAVPGSVLRVTCQRCGATVVVRV